MGREPEMIEGQFEVAAGSAKAGPQTIKKPGIWLPTVMALLAAVTWPAVMLSDPGPIGRTVCGLALCFTWPFWRAIQLAIWSAQCKVSDEDASRLADRYPTRDQRRSRA